MTLHPNGPPVTSTPTLPTRPLHWQALMDPPAPCVPLPPPLTTDLLAPWLSTLAPSNRRATVRGTTTLCPCFSNARLQWMALPSDTRHHHASLQRHQHGQLCWRHQHRQLCSLIHSLHLQSQPHPLARAMETIKVNSQYANCLFDSGSMESFIHPDLVQRCAFAVYPSDQKISLATRTLSTAIKKVTCWDSGTSSSTQMMTAVDGTSSSTQIMTTAD
ncbi:uncharacterized protein [Narcine bancroftii]|uniref:uncharacterized protein n=1 Tax=Narcine bancroftii TaxID=1343680 RepID=UPI0038312B8A